jgi:hypothetical protein
LKAANATKPLRILTKNGFTMFARKEFGWTPLEVDEQPAGTLDWLLAISAIVKKVESDNQ